MSGHSTTFHLSEAGDAEFFAAHYGNEVRFNHRHGKWLIFKGHRWVGDTDGELRRLALQAMKDRQESGKLILDLDDKKAHYKWTLNGESRTRLENMLHIARSVKPISDSGAGWDADPWLLGVRNGVLDIRTGLLRDGKPEDRITMSCAANYDPTAECPQWRQTFSNVFAGDVELMLYVQCALGYSITGITHEQVFFLNAGGGANGKGTVLNVIGTLLGDYSANLPFSSLEIQARGGVPNDIASLVGKRFVTASESKKGIQLDEARVKTLTGCDPITARFLYSEFFEFTPVAKFWLSCNDKPLVDDPTLGFWRRVKVVPWRATFLGEANDKELKARLLTEVDGILAWLVEGCLYGWRAMGLKLPNAVDEATKEYEAESDVLGPFIDACLTVGDKQKVGGQQLFQAYLKWFGDTDRGRRALSNKFFGIWAKKQWKSDTAANGGTTYFGVGVRLAG